MFCPNLLQKNGVMKYVYKSQGVDRGSPEQQTGTEEPPSERPALILRQYQDTLDEGGHS